VELPLNSLCKQNPFPQPAEEEKRAISALASASQEATTRRDLWVRQELTFDPSAANTQYSVQISDADGIRQLMAQAFSNAYNAVIEKPNIVALNPVQECAMAITWELLNCSCSRPVVHSIGGFDGLIRLLASAAVYQAGQEDVRSPFFFIAKCWMAIRLRSFPIKDIWE